MKKSQIDKIKQPRLIEPFVAGTTVRRVSAVGINKSTAIDYFQRFLEIIALQIAGVAIICWMFLDLSAIASIIQSFSGKKNHINGIENFWNQTKQHMQKFNRISKESFSLFLKKCE